MASKTMTSEQVETAAEAIYKRIRPYVEQSNLGKFISIDVLSGGYRIGDSHRDALDQLRSAFPEAESFTKRIGYDAAVVIGSSWHREK